MVNRWIALTIFVVVASYPVVAINSVLAEASHFFPLKGLFFKDKHIQPALPQQSGQQSDDSAAEENDMQSAPPQQSGSSVAEDKDIQLALPQPSEKVQACFTKLRFGISPGSIVNNTVVASVDECMSLCAVTEGCLAMTFRMADGLCNLLNRASGDKYEESDERVVADRIADCQVIHPGSLPADGKFETVEDTVIEVERKRAQVANIENIEQCFSTLVPGKPSPASSFSSDKVVSVEECMSRCSVMEDCLAMNFKTTDGLCTLLNRTYDDNYVKSRHRVIANKLPGCNSCLQRATVLWAKRIGDPGIVLDQYLYDDITDCTSLCAAVESCYAMARKPDECAKMEADVDNCVATKDMAT